MPLNGFVATIVARDAYSICRLSRATHIIPLIICISYSLTLCFDIAYTTTINTMVSTTNYRSTHFEVKNPTIITGEPTYDTLQRLYDQIKINAQSVASNRGGGNHGHLGLVLTNVEYSVLSLTPFLRHLNPGDFIYPVIGTPADQIAVLRQAHLDTRKHFLTIQQVKMAIK